MSLLLPFFQQIDCCEMRWKRKRAVSAMAVTLQKGQKKAKDYGHHPEFARSHEPHY
jgi:hypothetical protein